MVLTSGGKLDSVQARVQDLVAALSLEVLRAGPLQSIAELIERPFSVVVASFIYGAGCGGQPLFVHAEFAADVQDRGAPGLVDPALVGADLRALQLGSCITTMCDCKT
jgi:hypothetical protein